MVNDGYLLTSKLYEKRILNDEEIIVVFKPCCQGETANKNDKDKTNKQ